MAKRHRRVVTGHDAKGRSVVLMDGESPHSFFLEKAGGLQLTELWETRSSPADDSRSGDAASRRSIPNPSTRQWARRPQTRRIAATRECTARTRSTTASCFRAKSGR